MFGKFYTLICCIAVFVAILAVGCVYVVSLKNDINELRQVNLINSKNLQEKDLTIETYKKQILTYQSTIQHLHKKQQEYVKDFDEIDHIKISNDKIEEFRKSL
ncbi:MAG: hypothetical protein IJT15_02125 [Rickettsiales bacterium]|nr:hypothetical protein [Rickettsiales bacterium]